MQSVTDFVINLGAWNWFILAVALIGAIPYGAWQGLKRVRALISRRTHGNS